MAEPPPSRMATASMVLGLVSLPTFGILGIGAFAAIALGIVALMRANREPQAYGGQGRAIAGIATGALSLLVAIPLAGIVAAIAIPSLLRARIAANEAAAIGDVRAFVSGEAAYQSASGGYYGPPECLLAPAGCLPAYAGPPFADASLASREKSGYRREFHPGSTVDAALDGSPVPPRSLTSFAYVAVPVKAGQSGVRSFCGDASGRVCSVPSGPVEASRGECPAAPECVDLR
jgi:type IV pilus assembly protein PilA